MSGLGGFKPVRFRQAAARNQTFVLIETVNRPAMIQIYSYTHRFYLCIFVHKHLRFA